MQGNSRRRAAAGSAATILAAGLGTALLGGYAPPAIASSALVPAALLGGFGAALWCQRAWAVRGVPRPFSFHLSFENLAATGPDATPEDGDAVRFYRVAPHGWTADCGAWRIELACDGPPDVLWSLSLHRVGPTPALPVPVAHAACFDAVISASRRLLSAGDADTGEAGERLNGDLEFWGVAEGEVIIALAEGGYAKRNADQRVAVSGPDVEVALRFGQPARTGMRRDAVYGATRSEPADYSAARGFLDKGLGRKAGAALRLAWLRLT
jgi:hypothetical protein